MNKNYLSKTLEMAYRDRTMDHIDQGSSAKSASEKIPLRGAI